MIKTRCALLLLVLSACAAADTPSAMAATPSDWMARGKLAVDLGDPRAAETAFASLVADPTEPEIERAEALVRLGVVQRALGKAQASTLAFQRAMQSPARDAEVTRLLALALTGVAPDRGAWASQWRRVRLASSSRAATPRSSIQWPGPSPEGVREAFPADNPVTFELEDVPLLAFLHHFLVAWRPTDTSCPTCNWPGPRTTPGFENWPESYQPPAAVQRLGLVIHAGVQAHQAMDVNDVRVPRVTVKASELPWNEVLENVLASNGLGFVLEKTSLFIARYEDLGAFERIRGRSYGGPSITLNFLNGRLLDILRLFADITGFRIVPDEDLEGSVTMLVSERPALEVLDMVLAANDLAATRIDTPDVKPGTTALRIQRLAGARSDVVDVSRLVITPPLSAGFASFDGMVEVKRAGAHEWIPARPQLRLGPGDLVRTGSGGRAEIRFSDGTNFRVRADSCISIDARPTPPAGFVAGGPPQCRP